MGCTRGRRQSARHARPVSSAALCSRGAVPAVLGNPGLSALRLVRSRAHHGEKAPRRQGGRLMVIVLAAGKYIHWGLVSISLANLLVFVAMLVVFALALLIPFPGAH